MLIKKFDKQNLLDVFFKYLPILCLSVAIAISVYLYIFVIVNVPTHNGDNIEHVHSSFLILLGQVPYRDFFQHHNPLMWYLFVPLMHFMAYNSTVIEMVSFISFLFFLKSLIYVYRIGSEFLCDKLWALVMAALIAIPGYKIYGADFRPDNYSVLCIIGGIYYYFSYLKQRRLLYLNVAFIWFVVAFLFAQKALFPLFVLGLTGIYFWYKDAISTKDMKRALVIPAICMVGFLYYLYHYDMISLYYISNYTFNLELANSFDMTRIAAFPPYIKVFMLVGFLGACYSIKSKNRYWLVISLLFVTEYIQRRFYFSPYAYYYWLLTYFAVLCGVPLLYVISRRFKVIIWGIIGGIYFVIYGIYGFWNVFVSSQEHSPYLPNYISSHISPCDYVFNGDGMMYNLFGKDPAYYWQLIGQLDVIGERVGVADKPDINALIVELKPKFIYGRNYFNKFADETRASEIVHYVDQDIINEYYNPTSFGSIYQLKDKYQKQICEKDIVSGAWRYRD